MTVLSEWALLSLALIPVFFAARMGDLARRTPGLVGLQLTLAGWLVVFALAQISGADRSVGDVAALAFGAMFWIGARQWSEARLRVALPLVCAGAVAATWGFAPVARGAWLGGSTALFAFASSVLAIQALSRGGMLPDRGPRVMLGLASIAPPVLAATHAALSGAVADLQLHPVAYLPLSVVLGSLLATRSEVVGGSHDLAEPMMFIDDANRVIDGNRAAFTLLGVSDRNPQTLQRHALAVPALRRLLEEPDAASEEFCLGEKGAKRYYEARVVSSPLQVARRVLSVRDVTANHESHSRLERQANFDSLTGLANRRFFLERTEAAVAEADRGGSRLAVMYIDLDRFKAINDAYGHAAGDELLRTMAHRLRQHLNGRRAADETALVQAATLGRLGGDEFALLLPGIEGERDVAAVAERILALISEPVVLSGQRVGSAGSVGIAIYPDHGRDVPALLRAADVALYDAKSNSRGAHQTFRPELDAQTRRKAALDRHLRGAIASDEFEIHYQPKYATRGRELRGAEGLIRWKSAEFGNVPPREFIPVAEEFGLIAPIGSWVIEATCRAIAAWRAEGLTSVPVSINVSPKQFQGNELEREVMEALKKHDVSPEALEIELTESTLLDEDDSVVASLRMLRQVGVRVALDDFGTGYSSLSYLNRVPLDVIKLDRNFISDVHLDPAKEGVVAGVISMAHALDLEVVAEGVDCEEQLAVLERIDCDLIQGFVFGAAVEEREFRVLCEHGLAPDLASEVGAAQSDAAGGRVEPMTVVDLVDVVEPDAEGEAPPPEEPPEPESAEPERYILVVGDASPDLGSLALRMNRTGALTLYAQDFDEAVLFACEEDRPLGCIVVPVDAPSQEVSQLVGRAEAAAGRSPALVFVGEGDPDLKLLEIAIRCRIWVVRALLGDEALRHLLRVTLQPSVRVEVERMTPRVPCDLMARACIDGSSEAVLISSLSERGAFVETRRDLPVGALLDLEFSLGDDVIETRAKVLHHAGGAHAPNARGVGVFFIGLDGASEFRIGEYAKEHALRCLA